MPTPSKDFQDREAAERSNDVSPDDQALSAGALDTIEADTGQPQQQPTPPQDETDIRPDLPVYSPHDRARDAIAKGFREMRSQQAAEADEETQALRDNTSLPPEFRDQVSDQLPDEVLTEPSPQPPVDRTSELEPPQKFKVKVNGEEKELTYEEMIAAAQKSLAGDDYLGKAKTEARELLDEAKRLRFDFEATRTASRPAQNQGQPDISAQPGASDAPQPGDENHVDPFKDAAEKIQFGAPEDAQSALRTVVDGRATEISRQIMAEERRRTELARSVAAGNEFRAKHTDLANDPRAGAVMTADLFTLQREDLAKVGYTAEQLSKASNAQVADAHLTARAEGMPVRSIPDLLVIAKGSYDEWKGVPKPAPAPTGQQARQTPQRVEVQVNRTERRQAIPQQPARTAVPRQEEPPAQQPKDKSAIVESMRSARMRPRGGASIGA